MDLCFLSALYLRSSGEALAAFPEAELFHAFEDVCKILEPTAEHQKKRATHAIQRLRDQRLLARVDGRGVVQTGEFALTRLASGIVEFYLHEEALTRESLTLLTRTLLVSLAEVHRHAQSARTPEDFRIQIVGPLRVTIADLVAGIERRQRGLDLQQEDFQRQIGALLQSDWFGALERCQSLLEATSVTLRELNEILLRDSHELQSVLQEIQELAAAADAGEAEDAARRVVDQVDRITSWGSARQRAWSDYYEYVHHFLRDVVRLDPTRALTQRLREQLSGKRGQRFALTLANAPALRVLRNVAVQPEAPPVKRARNEREPVPEPDECEDPNAALEASVKASLDAGADVLSLVTAQVTAELPPEDRFRAAGRVAQAVAGLSRPRVARDKAWVAVGQDFVIEEWAVDQASPGEPAGSEDA